MARIPLDELNAMPLERLVAALGNNFEHSPWVVEAIAPARPFASLAALSEAMSGAVRGASPATRLALIQAHPDLAGKAARASALTAESTAEQAEAGLDRLSDDEFARFNSLNDAYHAKFGFPFIVCVRRHGKDSILRHFEARLRNDPTAEETAAIDEIMRIAALRLDELVAAPDRLNVHGRLSTHVLDCHAGRPAQGVIIELVELSGASTSRPITQTITNAEGRTDQPLIGGRPLPIGTYELRFKIGDYFARSGVTTTDPPFLDTIPIRFSIAEPEGHYHVPLVVTPWSYSTYRGS